jgi:hypothetical protein
MTGSDVVKQIGFPDPLAPDKVKDSKEYILQWGQAITHEWFSRNEGQDSCRFLAQKNDFHNRKLFARGEHPTDKLAQIVTESEDGESYVNFDTRPIQVLPRFIKIMVNSTYDRLFKVRAEATDKYSTDVRDEYRKILEDMMASREMMKEAKALHGVDMGPQGDEQVPESEQEIEVRMKRFKVGIERATEKLLDYTLDMNDYQEDVKRILEDLIVFGIGGAHHDTDPSKGIVTRAVDPADMVWSFIADRKLKDVYYYGEVKRMTLTEAMRISNLKLDAEKLRDLAITQDRWSTYMGYSNERTSRDEDMPQMMVDVLFFNFKAYNKLTYKKKYKPGNRISMIEKDEDFRKPDPSYKGYDAVQKTYDVWYKGAMILGTDILFNYGKCENMVRPGGLLHRTLPQYIMYALDPYQGRLNSPVGSVRLYIEQMQQVHVKIQQVIAQARPNGIAVDVHGLSEVTMGKGDETLDPLELLKIYNQTGTVFYSSVNDDGSMNYNREIIRELGNGVIKGLPELINSYNHLLELVRSTLGVPQGVDATLPDERTLVGVQKLAAASSNTATRHILDASLSITQRLCTALGLRMKTIFKNPQLKEAYINAVGKNDMKLLESLENYSLHDVSVIIQLRPDAEEIEKLNRALEIAIERDQISVADKLEIEDVAKENVKIAYAELELRVKKYAKRKEESKMAEIQAQGETNQKSTEAAAQAEIQKIQSQEAAKQQTERVKAEEKRATLSHEAQLEEMLMKKKFEHDILMAGFSIEASGMVDMEKEKIRASAKTGEQRAKSENRITGSMGDGKL